MQWLLRSGQRLLYMYCNKHLYWLYMSDCIVSSYWSSLQGRYERFCGRVPEYLHGGPLQTGLRLQWRHEWKFGTPGKARREVQVFKASLPSPVEGESAHFQLAVKVQTKKMDFRRYHSGTDSWYSSHSARWVNMSSESKYSCLAANHNKDKRFSLTLLVINGSIISV